MNDDLTRMVLSIATMLGFFGVLYCIFYVPMPMGVSELAYVMSGILGKMASDIIAYYVGSSSGSKEKTKAMMK